MMVYMKLDSYNTNKRNNDRHETEMKGWLLERLWLEEYIPISLISWKNCVVGVCGLRLPGKANR